MILKLFFITYMLISIFKPWNFHAEAKEFQMGFVGDIEKSTAASHNQTVVCVLDSWAHWREGEGKFQLSDIDASLCTQLVYRIAGLDNSTFKIISKDSTLTEQLGWYRGVVALSQKYPHLKVLLSVGGWSEGAESFSQVAKDQRKREVFIESVLDTFQEYGFHGLDVAWEYPAWEERGGSPKDKDNFPFLLRELKEAFGEKYLLTLTVAGNTHFAIPAYDVTAISKYVDQFNIKSFDYSGGWNNVAYHQSALEDRETYQSVTNTVNFYLGNGAPPEKLVVGIPLYGRTFLLNEVPKTGENGLNQPSNGPIGGNWVQDTFVAGYHELCYNITHKPEQWMTYEDEFCRVPFARNGRMWISFDNPDSIKMKTKYVIENKLKGILAWTIDTDDFSGKACGNSKVNYPLLRTINYNFALEAGIKVSARDDLDQGQGRQDIPTLKPNSTRGKQDIPILKPNSTHGGDQSNASSNYGGMKNLAMISLYILSILFLVF